MTRPTPPYGDESFGFGKGTSAGDQRPVSRRDGVLPLAVAQDRQDLPPRHRGRVGIRRAGRLDHRVLASATTPSKLDQYALVHGEFRRPASSGRPEEPRIRGASSTCTATSRNGSLDHYDPKYYAQVPAEAPGPVLLPVDRRYPYVARGGSWDDPAARLRSAARRGSSEEWNRRDPQSPQSIWWHTDADLRRIPRRPRGRGAGQLERAALADHHVEPLARIEAGARQADEHRHVETF